MLRACLYVVGLYGAYAALRLRGLVSEPRRRGRAAATFTPPPATLALTAIVTLMAVAQWRFPAILTALRRDYSRFVAGEWWRVLTALFVQDGGPSGAMFNIVGLLFIGSAAERQWGARRWLAIFFLGGLASEVVALGWRPIGAGNSVANFSLAGSVVVTSLARVRGAARVAALSAAAACLWLLILHDIHGAAAFVGALLGVCLRPKTMMPVRSVDVPSSLPSSIRS
jgi:membrane associated rhomboid family serine protease